MSRVGDLVRERVGEKQCLHPLSPSLALPVFAPFAKMSSSMDLASQRGQYFKIPVIELFQNFKRASFCAPTEYLLSIR